MKTPYNAAGFNPHEQKVLDAADTFMATRFAGRGKYVKLAADTLAVALVKGETLRTQMRGVLIYAIAGRSQTLVTTLPPLPKEKSMFHLVVCLPEGKFAITSYPYAEQRDEAAAKEEQRHYKIDTAAELEAAFNQTELFDLYNYFATKPISVMKDKPWLVERILGLMNPQAKPGEAFVQPPTADADEAPANQEGQMAATTKSKSKKVKPKAVKTAKQAAKTNGVKAPRKDSKTEAIAALLKRKGGCTSKDVLELTGWPSVSMPAISKACGLKLRKEKVKGSPTHYYGE